MPKKLLKMPLLLLKKTNKELLKRETVSRKKLRRRKLKRYYLKRGKSRIRKLKRLQLKWLKYGKRKHWLPRNLPRKQLKRPKTNSNSSLLR